MDLSTITMDRTEARKAFLDYRKAVRERHDAEDEAIMRGYRELAKGRQIIELPATIRTGGLVERRARDGDIHRLPALAIIRASARECRVEVRVDGSVRFGEDEAALWNSRLWRRRVDLPAGTFDADPNRQSWHDRQFRAMVPLIPPPLRPAHALSNYHILWEADWRWAPLPPRDPALLKHLGGNLYAVLAVWDLTELERAVLAGRTAS